MADDDRSAAREVIADYAQAHFELPLGGEESGVRGSFP